MQIFDLPLMMDQEACIRAQRTNLNSRRPITMPTVAELAVARAKARKSKGGNDVKPSKKTAPAKKGKVKSSKKESTPRVQIKDKKGHPVTGRDNKFVCVECGHEITGPWSYKNHLVKVHDYSRKEAGLRGEVSEVGHGIFP